MFWSKKKTPAIPKVYRFEVRPTGRLPWKYKVYDTLRDMWVPKTEHTYDTITQEDADYYNSLDDQGFIFEWEREELERNKMSTGFYVHSTHKSLW